MASNLTGKAPYTCSNIPTQYFSSLPRMFLIMRVQSSMCQSEVVPVSVRSRAGRDLSRNCLDSEVET